ncbi:hypothetical protein [Rhodococcus sp. NPDC049939]|uniref:hypothetical protein n=1 Tax=Rhodococcus sp. NPDC049939 TaxID=3155511 RepID=UPI0033C3742C
MNMKRIVVTVVLGGGLGLGYLGVGAGLANADPVPLPAPPHDQAQHNSSPWAKFGLGWGDPWYNPGVNDSLNLGLLGHHGKH